jgi:hypothetical protein
MSNLNHSTNHPKIEAIQHCYRISVTIYLYTIAARLRIDSCGRTYTCKKLSSKLICPQKEEDQFAKRSEWDIVISSILICWQRLFLEE